LSTERIDDSIESSRELDGAAPGREARWWCPWLSALPSLIQPTAGPRAGQRRHLLAFDLPGVERLVVAAVLDERVASSVSRSPDDKSRSLAGSR
jgi:hypothetical protein